MNDPQDIINALVKQRDDALNKLAIEQATTAGLERRIAELAEAARLKAELATEQGDE